MVDQQVATVVGRFHLTRKPEGGGDASGIFSLVLQKQSGEWLIILDHTS
jgi:ketosteroid isomerase-like protein